MSTRAADRRRIQWLREMLRGYLQGRYCPERGARSCTPCPPGTRGRRFSNVCSPCLPGFNTFSSGQRECRKVGAPCPSNLFETRDGDCTFCSFGFFLNVTSLTCQTCPPGTISPGGMVRRCRMCPPDQEPNIDRNMCLCNGGMAFDEDGKCQKCPAGTFTNNNFSVRCPEGLMPNIPRFGEREEANGCVLPTTGCPPGYVRQDVGLSRGPIFGCRRIACRVGTPEAMSTRPVQPRWYYHRMFDVPQWNAEKY